MSNQKKKKFTRLMKYIKMVKMDEISKVKFYYFSKIKTRQFGCEEKVGMEMKGKNVKLYWKTTT
jgi:hypothetical protein